MILWTPDNHRFSGKPVHNNWITILLARLARWLSRRIAR